MVTKTAQVGRLDEAIGELAIGVLDGVDVRRVDEDEPGLDRVVLDEPELRRRDAGERPVEKADTIVGMEEDDRDAGGRTQDAGLAGGATGDRVEDRALAGSGRTDEHHEQRRVERRGADPDVPGEVIGELRRASERRPRSAARRQATLGQRLQALDEVAQMPTGRSHSSVHRNRHRRPSCVSERGAPHRSRVAVTVSA